MKIIFSILLAVIMFITCSCNVYTNHGEEILFYYPRAEYLFNSPEGVIGSEINSSKMNDSSLNETIELYLQGTKQNDLISPLSSGVELLETRIDKNGLHIIFTSNLADLPSPQLTLSLSALAKTVFQFTDVDTICIHADNVLLSGEQKIEFTRDSVCFWDSFTDVIPTEYTTETDDESA